MKKSDLIAGVSLAMLAAPALAQPVAPSVDEVIVTARKVAEDVQDVPISMTALSGERLTQGRTFNTESLNNAVPNLKVFKTVGNTNAYAVFVRGVGRDNNAFIVESPIATYIDDVYYPYTAGPVLEVGGLDRVEVLRGPQGTLYGRNATVGAIKYVTTRPDLDEPAGMASVTVGEFDRLEARAGIGAPIKPGQLAARLDLGYNGYGGYIRDLTSGGLLNGSTSASFRASLLWEPTDALQVYVSADGMRARDEANLGTPMLVNGTTVTPLYGSPYVSRNTLPVGLDDLNDTDVAGVTVQGVYDLGWGTFKSVSAFRGVQQVYAVDISAGLTPNSYTFANSVDHTFTQEFQLTGNALSDRLSYVAGFFYLTSDLTATYRRPGGLVAYTAQDTQSVAGYLDATYHLTEALSVSAGVRYTRDEKQVDQLVGRNGVFAASGEKSWNSTTPRFGVDYKITDNAMLYVSWGKGFKAGGLNTLEPATLASAAVFIPPEEIENYEAGVKTEWFDRRLTFNANYFHGDYTNQAQAALAGNPVTTVLFFADARIKGFEFEAHARPIDQWRIDATLGLLNAEYTQVPPQHPASAFADKTLKHAPEISYMISSDYTFEQPFNLPGSLSFGATYSYVDDAWESIVKSPLSFQEAYDTVDLRAVYKSESGRYEVVLAGANVTDTEVFKVVSVPTTRFYTAPAEWSVTVRFKL